MPQRTALKLLAFSLGVASLGIQILLLRQFMTVFYGNELVIGLVLAIWLLWVGVGSAFGHAWWKNRSTHISTFAFFLFLKLNAAFCVFVATKHVRLFFDIPYGQYLSFTHIFVFAAGALLIPAALAGFLFALLARLCKMKLNENDSAAFVYAYEAIGTVAVGLLFTFLPASWSGLASLILLTALLFNILFVVTRSKTCAAVALVFIALLWSPLPQSLETLLLQKYWRTVDESFQLKEWRYSRFGQSSIVKWSGDKILYHNGAKVSPLQNDIDNQALAATVSVQHQKPQKILLIQGNVGNLALEFAKCDVHVDAIELDENMFRFAQKHMDADQQRVWQNIDIEFTDAHRVLKKSNESWDMIIVNVGAPTTALSNRYYTDSFFHQAKTSLNENGVLALCHFPAGEHFLGEELLSLNKIVLNTLQYEFSNVLALPGDNAIYFASNSEILSSSLPELEQRLLDHNPAFQYFDISMLTYIYQQSRIDDFAALLNSSNEKAINNDFKPVSYLFDFLIWHKIVRGENEIIRAIVSTNLKTVLLLLAVALFVICVFLFIFSNKKIKLMRIRTAATIIGLAGMVCNIILLLSFQTLFGYIYTWVGLAMAAYMAGTAGASLLIVNMVPADRARSVLVGLFLIIITILLLLLPIIRILANLGSPTFYIFLFMMAGALVGAAFPLLCRLFSTISGNIELGRIYAADVLGGAVGAFFVSSFLAPLYGFFNTLIMTAFLCTAGFVLVVVHKK